MKLSKYYAYYNLLTGISMFTIWGVLLFTGDVPELKTEPVDITYHLLAEGFCATILVFAGIELLRQSGRGLMLSMIGWGSLLYSVLTNVPYYIGKGDEIMVSVFTILQIATMALMVSSLKDLGVAGQEFMGSHGVGGIQ